MTENGAAVAEVHNGVEETGWNGSNTRLEAVNNMESSRMEAQLKFVNNNNEGLKMENRSENEGDEFD